MDPTPLKDLPEDLVEYNRARYRQELAQSIYSLMRRQGVKRSDLAELMGFESRSRVTHILSGEKNLQADTIADLFLVLGKAPHVAIGNDPDQMRPPIDLDEDDSDYVVVTDATFPRDSSDDKQTINQLIKPIPFYGGSESIRISGWGWFGTTGAPGTLLETGSTDPVGRSHAVFGTQVERNRLAPDRIAQLLLDDTGVVGDWWG